MATAGNQFGGLDKNENLKPRVAKTGKRRVGDGREDEVFEAMTKAQAASGVAKVASDYGVPAEVIVEKARTAPNFGQFLMTMTNMCRGVVARRTRAIAAGYNLSYAQCGTKKLTAAAIREIKARNKPAKAAPVAKAAATKGAAAPAAKKGGAPSKADLVKTKGAKKRASRGHGIKTVDNDAAAADVPGQQTLDEVAPPEDGVQEESGEQVVEEVATGQGV